jgi:hypothetical protein
MESSPLSLPIIVPEERSVIDASVCVRVKAQNKPSSDPDSAVPGTATKCVPGIRIIKGQKKPGVM